MTMTRATRRHPALDAGDRDAWDAHRDRVLDGAEARAAARQHPQGKHTARERLRMLLDAGSFLELGQFRGGSVTADYAGSAVVTGFGAIGGRRVAAYAQDFAVRGGTLGEVEGRKIVDLLDAALRERVPVVALLDSGGARIQEGVAALDQYGRIFRATSRASGVVPQISVVLGPCAGGAVYSPALTDLVVMVRGSAHMFVTGPDVVRAVTGEDVDADALGGADVHGGRSGVAHYVAEDEDDALDYVRAVLTYLPQSCEDAPPRYAYEGTAQDLVDARALAELVPGSSKLPYDMVQAIRLIVDHGEFVQVHESFAPNVAVGFACLAGLPVGIVANQPLRGAGTLDVDASEKAARFVRFCDAFGLPIVTLVDVPGYKPGAEQEHRGIIRRGAKLLYAYANATVPMVTVILRKAYGGAYIVMGSKAIGADMAFAWPGAQIAVLGAEGAVDVVERRHLRETREGGGDWRAERARLAERYRTEVINPDLAVRTGAVDALITPESTRDTLVSALRALARRQGVRPARRHGNGPL